MMIAENRSNRSPLLFVPSQVAAPGVENRKPTFLQNPETNHLAVVITDALIARDVAVQHLQSACASLRDKEETIARIEREKKELKLLNDMGNLSVGETKDNPLMKERSELLDKIEQLERSNANLTQELRNVNEMQNNELKMNSITSPLLSPNPATIMLTPQMTMVDDHEERLNTRYTILSQLPLPSDMPSEILLPIVVPPPFTVHDFIGTITGPMKIQLANYRVFQEYTTSWCPEREEHGYYLSPVFKCMTNPRTPTAHRWVVADIAAQIAHPMECFYNKEGKWYYAGIYKAFRLDDLSISEWDKLSPEASQSVIKDTLTHRKNTSPQNVYEASQLYAAGALKVACIGLQCIGFNNSLYKGLLEQAETCKKGGRWRLPPTAGLGTAGGIWNTTANTTAKTVLGAATELAKGLVVKNM
ncbi:hypothetical protein QCA50_006074 [Cerrena zonata]|uniref:DUF6697 domain-containing protein n=1 Tax=Cerrena zonata TaxID=2478898 RepID=A0AAW0GDG5_9APHY